MLCAAIDGHLGNAPWDADQPGVMDKLSSWSPNASPMAHGEHPGVLSVRARGERGGSWRGLVGEGAPSAVGTGAFFSSVDHPLSHQARGTRQRTPRRRRRCVLDVVSCVACVSQPSDKALTRRSAQLLWCRKMVANARRHCPLAPWKSYAEVCCTSAADASGQALAGGAVIYATDSPVQFAGASDPLTGARTACFYVGTPINNASELRELYGLTEATEGTENTDGAQLLLDLYLHNFEDVYGDASDQPSTALACLHANYAFLILDAAQRRLLVARSGIHAPPLFWATARDGALRVASDPQALEGLAVRPASGPAMFPSGCFFVEAEADCDGQPHLESFTHALGHRGVTPVTRINSRGQLCGLGFHSQSGKELATLSVGAALYPSVGWTM